MSWQYYPYLPEHIPQPVQAALVPQIQPSPASYSQAPPQVHEQQRYPGQQGLARPSPPALPVPQLPRYPTASKGELEGHSAPIQTQQHTAYLNLPQRPPAPPSQPQPQPRPHAFPNPHLYPSFSYHTIYTPRSNFQPQIPPPLLPLEDPSQTNWGPPLAAAPTAVQTTDPASSSSIASPFSTNASNATHMLSDNQAQVKPPMLARTRRAEASKARSTISSMVTSLTSPPFSAASVSSSHPPSHSYQSSAKEAPGPSEYEGNLIEQPHSTAVIPSQSNFSGDEEVMTTVITEEGAIQVALKNSRGNLLPAPPGAQLEVNDLLILHPPTLSPSRTPSQPMNQYNHAPAPEGYRSAFEMYTCRVCAKTYDGRNARSVARRHLQDKHGVPLSLQQRRTRWDAESDRPKSAAAVREKTLKIKREWASKARTLHKLEREHATFLEKYGPNGIYTPSGTRAIAPSMRNAPARLKNKEWPCGWLLWGAIPKTLREGLAALSGTKLPDIPEQQQEPMDDHPLVNTGDRITSYDEYLLPSGTFCRSTSSSRNVPPAPPPTPPSFASSRLGPNTTPPSDPNRSAHVNQWGPWAPATHVDDRTLEIAIAQHYESFQDSENQEQPDEGPDNSAPSSPEASYTDGRQPGDLWTAEEVSSRLWFSHVTEQEEEQEEVLKDNGEGEAVKKEAEVETVAAESLLNLHSTPARPENSVRQQHDDEGMTNEGEEDEEREEVGLLEAPVITIRSRPHRTKSLVRPFAKSRPEAATRSLSSGEIGALDDPFAMSPSADLSKRRRSTIASPSHLISKRQREQGESPRVPMSILRANTIGTTGSLQGGYTTPVRPKGNVVPSSLGKGWVLSSPGNVDAAASLGLVPQWDTGSHTPGLIGLVGSETPSR